MNKFTLPAHSPSGYRPWICNIAPLLHSPAVPDLAPYSSRRLITEMNLRISKMKFVSLVGVSFDVLLLAHYVLTIYLNVVCMLFLAISKSTVDYICSVRCLAIRVGVNSNKMFSMTIHELKCIQFN